jgi:hypothetical protein
MAPGQELFELDPEEQAKLFSQGLDLEKIHHFEKKFS